ncbi:hypothetical protein F441_21509 [Phytophthora nicotianae CJ01A1]|uniref:Uncharacterized protein n=1 Tax=Phytophthora nicotianae CJ01A1 TaxID=1317063 RepID=W2VU32_PHYNI|nr:hypothetical protein F441_21509 [Phytophthora nicotianae CJ01A1]
MRRKLNKPRAFYARRTVESEIQQLKIGLIKATKESEIEQQNRDQYTDARVRICGSCRELSKSARMVKKRYLPRETYFAPLKNADRVCEAIAEAITEPDASGVCFIWICNRCHTFLTKKNP